MFFHPLWTVLSLSCQTTWQHSSFNPARRIKSLTSRKKGLLDCVEQWMTMKLACVANSSDQGCILGGEKWQCWPVCGAKQSIIKRLGKGLGRGEQMWEQSGRREGSWIWRFQVSCDVTRRSRRIILEKKKWRTWKGKKAVTFSLGLVMHCSVGYSLPCSVHAHQSYSIISKFLLTAPPVASKMW